ncbi:MAG: serine protease [Caldilineaceae bacterium]
MATVVLFVMLLHSIQPAFAVVGGTVATLSARNWVVGVAMADVADGYYAQFCGGALLAPNWVITAAHCTFDENDQPYEAGDLHVLVNRLRLSSYEGQRILVAHIVRHPGFDIHGLSDDIALLELAHDADAPTINWGNLDAIDAQNATVFGWGVTEDGAAVDWLRQAELPLVSQLACNIIYQPYGFKITDNMLCAGNILGGVDACTGDSGGPLVVYDDHRAEWVLAGIVSWGAGCGASGSYGVYTKVSTYGAWIVEQRGLFNQE